MSVTIDKNIFHDRLDQLISAWKMDKNSSENVFGGVNSIVICHGKATEGAYSKKAAFQLWLLGYEFPATLIVITQEGIHFAAKSGKANYLRPLVDGKVPVHIHTITSEDKKKALEECLAVIKSAGPLVGTPASPKEEPTGPFADDWKAVFSSSGIETANVSLALSVVAFSIKDEPEVRAIRDASRASSCLMKDFLVKEMANVIDSEGEVTHQQLADKVRAKLEDNSFFRKRVKSSADFDPMNLDWAMDPVVQSGGVYDLKFSTPADSRKLNDGVIVAALGLRYQAYSSMLARTYIVDPSPSQEAAYKLLLKVNDAVLKSIKDGVQANEVYNTALTTIRAADAEFETYFVKNVGCGIGIEFRDSFLALNAKNTRVLKSGMTLVVSVGFSNIECPDAKSKSGKNYSLFIANTVYVTSGEVNTLTKDAPTDPDSVLFFFDDEPEPAPKKGNAPVQPKVRSTRSRDVLHNEEKEAERRENQRKMHKSLHDNGLERFASGAGSMTGKQVKKVQKFESYKQVVQMPSAIKHQRVFVDKNASTVIVPIMGRPVPFHVNTIKSASITPEGDAVALRLNFVSPGQGIARKDDQPFEDPTAQFIRNLTFRSTDKDRLEKIASEITELKKAATQREQARLMMADVVEQGKLVPAKDRRPAKLDMLFLRPPLDGKRMPGHIEIHHNGIRYVHGHHGVTVDVLFSNVKHLFFQPCSNELIVIIHLHLKSPIMVGKKKTYDVQFYREAADMAFDETGHRKRKHNRYGDDEEIEAEREERRRRAELDKEFHSYTKKIQEAGATYELKADMPLKDLGFTGVPSRSSVWMQPTMEDCLVQLTEPPFFVVALNEIELVHFERVMFGLKQFDMVVIFQDYGRTPMHVNTIPVEFLDPIKDWLNESSIPYSEGTKNLVWTSIMKTITADPHEFFESGGWSFLQAESDSEDDEQDDDSEFELESGQSESELSDSDSDSDGGSAASDSASGASASEAEDSDDGDDWEELERKAKEHDRRIGHDDGMAKKRKR